MTVRKVTGKHSTSVGVGRSGKRVVLRVQHRDRADAGRAVRGVGDPRPAIAVVQRDAKWNARRGERRRCRLRLFDAVQKPGTLPRIELYGAGHGRDLPSRSRKSGGNTYCIRCRIDRQDGPLGLTGTCQWHAEIRCRSHENALRVEKGARLRERRERPVVVHRTSTQEVAHLGDRFRARYAGGNDASAK